MTWTRNRTVAAVFVAAAISAACGGNGADATSAEMSGQTGNLATIVAAGDQSSKGDFPRVIHSRLTEKTSGRIRPSNRLP